MVISVRLFIDIYLNTIIAEIDDNKTFLAKRSFEGYLYYVTKH